MQKGERATSRPFKYAIHIGYDRGRYNYLYYFGGSLLLKIIV